MDMRSVGPAASLPMPLHSNKMPPMPGFSGDELSASFESRDAESSEMHDAFTDFVGQTLFGSMLSSMRKTLNKPAYMHGGRTEEVFQQQLDQTIVEDLTKSSAGTIADPMFELFNLQRRS